MKMSKKINATVYEVTAYGDTEAVRLRLNPKTAMEINDTQWCTGVTMVRCWFGKNRVVTEEYSIWDNGHGSVCGTQYSVLTDKNEILHFCDHAEIAPPKWIAIEEV